MTSRATERIAVRGPVRVIAVCTLAANAMALAGCQRIVDVTGSVRVDGEPAKGVIVMFDPASQDMPRGVATTDASGAYRLRRLGPGSKPGVPTGTYTVKVMSDMDNPGAGRIPDRYFRRSQLTSEVRGPSPHVYDIEISTK